MAFPDGWPPRGTNTVRSVRVFATGDTTALFSDNAILFGDYPSANVPLPYLAPGSTATIVVPPVPGGGRSPYDAMGGVQVPKPHITCRMLYVYNDGPGIIEVSFDGVNVHDEIRLDDTGGGPNTTAYHQYEDRQEGGIALRIKPASVASHFRICGW